MYIIRTPKLRAHTKGSVPSLQLQKHPSFSADFLCDDECFVARVSPSLAAVSKPADCETPSPSEVSFIVLSLLRELTLESHPSSSPRGRKALKP